MPFLNENLNTRKRILKTFLVYVEADVDRCNKLTFNFGDGVVTTVTMSNSRGLTATATQSWDIRVGSYI